MNAVDTNVLINMRDPRDAVKWHRQSVLKSGGPPREENNPPLLPTRNARKMRTVQSEESASRATGF